MISKQLLKTIIVDGQNRNHDNLWDRSQNIPVDSGKVITLTGVRRSGKTCHLYRLINQLLNNGIDKEKILFINFEDERLFFDQDELDLIIQSFQELYPQQSLNNCYFFFDEVQAVPGWEKFITRLYETICKNVFITGSNSKLLSKEIATSLRGRTITYEVFPLSFSEYARIFRPDFNLFKSSDRADLFHLFEKFMITGGFPELIFTESKLYQRILQEYFNVMLFRDLVEHFQITNTPSIKYFCKRLIGSSGGEFSINKLFNEMKSQGIRISKDSLYEFQDYVESVNICRFIKKWSLSIEKSERSLRKCYVIDHGLGAALDYKFSQDRGRVLETISALELIKNGLKVTYQQIGGECDFLISDETGVIEALQVALDVSDPKTLEREVKGLLQSCKQHNLKSGTILTLDQSQSLLLEEHTINILPAWEYFLSMNRLL